MPDEFLTVNEIAERLKLNPQTVRNWIDAGRLPAFRVGRRVRIRREDFEAVLAHGLDVGRGDRRTGDAFWDGELDHAPLMST